MKKKTHKCKRSNGNPHFEQPTSRNPLLVLHGDVRDVIKKLPDNTFQCAITSPPYWGVRDYGVDRQIGAELDLADYISQLVSVFSEVRRVLKPDGTFWLNIGNTYTSGGRTWRQEDSKNKGRAMSYRPPTPEGLKKKGKTDVLLVAGGIIPDEDIPALQKVGIKAIFGPGTPTSKIIEFIRSELAGRNN